MTKEKRFKISKNWDVSIYHFYDNWKITDRFTMFNVNLIGFGWENFGRGKILGFSKTYNIYFNFFGINFCFMRVKSER